VSSYDFEKKCEGGLLTIMDMLLVELLYRSMAKCHLYRRVFHDFSAGTRKPTDGTHALRDASEKTPAKGRFAVFRLGKTPYATRGTQQSSGSPLIDGCIHLIAILLNTHRSAQTALVYRRLITLAVLPDIGLVVGPALYDIGLIGRTCLNHCCLVVAADLFERQRIANPQLLSGRSIVSAALLDRCHIAGPALALNQLLPQATLFQACLIA